MVQSKIKGNTFERQICHLLSKWWTRSDRTDVFWRTSNSGGRATHRTKRGSDTINSHGDICAIDPIGMPLLDIMTIELKCGYQASTIHDLLDKNKHAALQTYEKWIERAVRSQKEAGSAYWAIIAKRSGRIPIILFPSPLLTDLAGETWADNRPRLTLQLPNIPNPIVCVRLEEFLSRIDPLRIIELSNRRREQ